MKIGIISGRFPATEFDSIINHKIYADKFNYTYIHCNWPTKSRNPYLNKIYYILSYFDYFDYIIWLDDDAFFYDFEQDIMDYAPDDGRFMSLCKSPSYKELKTFFSSGQFIIKCTALSKSYLHDVINTDIIMVKNWWTGDMGYYTNGDQDIMVYLFLTQEKYKDKMVLHNYKCFNSRWENIFNVDIHKPLILHFTGNRDSKRKNYRQAQHLLNIHSALVPNRILIEYNKLIIRENYKKVTSVYNNCFGFKLIIKLKKWLKR